MVTKAGVYASNCCIDTAGYLSNFEIRQSIANPEDFGGSIKTWSTEDGDLFMLSDDTQWVSYLSDESYSHREEWIGSQQLGGLVDWAVDLGKDFDIDAHRATGKNEPVEPLCSFSMSFVSFDELDAVSDIFPAYCPALYSLDTLCSELQNALTKYLIVNSHYDELFGYYVVKYIKEMTPGALEKLMREGRDDYFNYTLTYMWSVSMSSCASVMLPDFSHNLTYVLRDEEGFYKQLQEKYAISPG
ncbi:hypothetical protein ACHAQJ_007939 [Trichoderma viride]